MESLLARPQMTSLAKTFIITQSPFPYWISWKLAALPLSFQYKILTLLVNYTYTFWYRHKWYRCSATVLQLGGAPSHIWPHIWVVLHIIYHWSHTSNWSAEVGSRMWRRKYGWRKAIWDYTLQNTNLQIHTKLRMYAAARWVPPCNNE